MSFPACTSGRSSSNRRFRSTRSRRAAAVRYTCSIATRSRCVETAVAVLVEIRAQNPAKFEWRQPPYEYEHTKLPFDILAGSSELREQIEAGQPVRTISESWVREHERFRDGTQAVLAVLNGHMDHQTRSDAHRQIQGRLSRSGRRARGRVRQRARREARAWQVERARNRASPRRQRDDVGRQAAVARRRRERVDSAVRREGIRQSGSTTTGPSRIRCSRFRRRACRQASCSTR